MMISKAFHEGEAKIFPSSEVNNSVKPCMQVNEIHRKMQWSFYIADIINLFSKCQRKMISKVMYMSIFYRFQFHGFHI